MPVWNAQLFGQPNWGQIGAQAANQVAGGPGAIPNHLAGARDRAGGAIAGGALAGMGLMGQGYQGAGRALTGGFVGGMGALSEGRDAARGAFGQAAGAIGGGLQGAGGVLAPYIGQDMAARGAYAQALMGDDSAFWQRQSDQRASNINQRLANQGLLGSSGGRNALIESDTQLQQAREQAFYDRARALFNPGAAGQLAGMYGAGGNALAGVYGNQAGMEAGMGRFGAGQWGQFGQGLAGINERGGVNMGNVAVGAGRDLGSNEQWWGNALVGMSEAEANRANQRAMQESGQGHDWGMWGANTAAGAVGLGAGLLFGGGGGGTPPPPGTDPNQAAPYPGQLPGSSYPQFPVPYPDDPYNERGGWGGGFPGG